MIKKLTAITGMLALASFVATSAFAAPKMTSTKAASKQHHTTVQKPKPKPVTHHSDSGHH